MYWPAMFRSFGIFVFLSSKITMSIKYILRHFLLLIYRLTRCQDTLKYGGQEWIKCQSPVQQAWPSREEYEMESQFSSKLNEDNCVFWFHINFKIKFSVSAKKFHWNFDKNCTESIDCFGLYGHLNSIKPSTPWTQDAFPLICAFFNYF